MSDDVVGDREHRARRMWRAVEPLHAVTYFAPESKAACDALGTKGFWMSYFAQRAAPLGAASPELVTALFYNFHPHLVARAVPDVWAVAPPSRFLQARVEGVDAALRRLLGQDAIASPALAEAAEIARAAALAAPTAGRALAAANAALEWPDMPHLVLWHAQTVLREQRGDGHVAALLAAGLDPAEALVLFAADSDLDGDWMRQRRGWSELEWAAAVQRLVARGLFVAGEEATAGGGVGGPAADPRPGDDAARPGDDAAHSTLTAEITKAGGLTTAGRALRDDVEARTDALADAPWAAVGADRAERLVELVAPLVAAVLAGEGFLPVNPMGLRPLVRA